MPRTGGGVILPREILPVLISVILIALSSTVNTCHAFNLADITSDDLVFYEPFDTPNPGWGFSSRSFFIEANFSHSSETKGRYCTEDFVVGGGSLRIDSESWQSGGWWYLPGHLLRGWRDYLVPGEEYTLTFWVKTDGFARWSGGFGLWYQWNNGASMVTRWHDTKGTWQQLAIVLRVPKGATDIAAIYFRFEGMKGSAWIDDVRIYRGRLDKELGLAKLNVLGILDSARDN